jgi:hypothetical protein
MTVEDRRNGDLLSADLYMYKIIKAEMEEEENEYYVTVKVY